MLVPEASQRRGEGELPVLCERSAVADDLVAESFRQGTARTVDAPKAWTATHRVPEVRSLVLFPMGEDGLLLVGARRRSGFADRKAKLVQMLATTGWRAST